MKKKRKYLYIVGVLLFLTATHFFGAQMGMLGDLMEHQFPGIVSSSSYKREIESKRNLENVYSAYYILEHRADPIAVDLALTDLKSSDDYLWLNAAVYLSSLDRKESIPYLIKSLQHTAGFSVDERLETLKELSGEDFGFYFPNWKSWWEKENPDSTIDWASSLGFRPRLWPDQNKTETEPDDRGNG